MFPPFNPELAHHYCISVCSKLDSGFLHLNQITRLSQERAGQGVMIGTLVCTDGDNQRVILVTNSGISKQIALPDGKDSFSENGIQFILVKPVVSAESIDKALNKNDYEIHRLTDLIKKASGSEKELSDFKETRKKLCAESLSEVHKLYRFHTIDTNKIFTIENLMPPTGTGDCCEPKLLDYAFSHNLRPLSMDQVFYSLNNGGLGVSPRREGCAENNSPKDSCLRPGERLLPSISPCDERCGLILPDILGLEVIYQDNFIVVVNKPSGLLSVPGRGPDKQDCVVNRVKLLYPELCRISQIAVHRLDMETSGLLVLAFTEEAHKNLSAQFENGTVHKEYCALLEGVLEKEGCGLMVPRRGEKSGEIRLKCRLDVENRPHQIYDDVNGKEGITLWENEGIVNYVYPGGTRKKATKIRFRPQTGRTHQLRLASAECHGFGLPIIGDSLYGSFAEGQRLMLHAEKITFRHPNNGHLMTFEKKAPF